MKRSLLALLSVVMSWPAFSGDWKLVWSDEFDRPGAPDPNKWTYEEGFVRNRELQYYTRERLANARVETGHLILEARKERQPNPRYQPDASSRDWKRSREYTDYTSGSLTTRGKASWCYGRIEVRAKLPKGRGTWPAIWMLGDDKARVGWPACGEIDILEHVGHNPNVVHANVHTRDYNHVKGTGRGDKIVVEDVFDTWHVYAVEWFEDRMDFYVDDRKCFTCRNDGQGVGSWPFDQPEYLILNIAIGGSWGGQKGVDDEAFPARMLVDYVRVFSR